MSSVAQPLLAGVARRDITPPPGIDLAGFVARLGANTGALDPISVTALVLQSGSTRAALVAFDLLGLSAESVAELRARITAACDIPADHVLFAASHSHSAPAPQVLHRCGDIDSGYMVRLHAAIVASVTEAAGHLQPVHTASGQKNDARLAALHINRRVAGGPLDSTLAAIRFTRATDSTPLAAFFNFSCHPVVLGADSRLVSADWVGAARRTIETGLGGAPALFGNGPAGNVNPAQRGTPAIAKAMGQTIGEHTLELLAALPAGEPDTTLTVRRMAVTLPMRALPDQRELERLYTEAITAAEAHAQKDTSGDQIAEKSQRVFADWAKRALDAGLAGREPEPTPAEVQILRIGKAILVGFPGETFLEFGMELRREFGRDIVPLGYTNINVGYVPWHDAYPKSGYEVDVAYKYYGYPAGFSAEAGARVLEAARAGVRAVR